MTDVLKRKCAHCKEEMVIERNHISGVVFFKNSYYHTDCLVQIATEKAFNKKTGKPTTWYDVVDKLPELEKEAKTKLNYYWMRDDFNNWILEHYDVVAVPDRFWSVMCDVSNGIYKKKKCKPIPMEDIFNTWKWGQSKLDKIAIDNKMSHRGPTTGDERVLYDLSIVIRKIPNYLAYEAKNKALEVMVQYSKNTPKINYDNLDSSTNNNQFDDISDLLDEIF